MKKLLARLGAIVLLPILAACGSDGNGPDAPKVTPAVTEASVANGATGVPASLGKITVTWSVPVRIANAAGITLSGGMDITSVVTNKVLTVSFGELAGSTAYTLNVAAGAIVNKDDGQPAGAYTLTFMTERAVLANPDISGNLVFDIDNSPVNPKATAGTKALYAYLKNIFGSKTLSGSMAEYTVGTESADWVHGKTGKYPAIACFDFMNVNRWDKYQGWDRPYSELVANAKSWAANGGIVACMWHWRDPSGKTDAFYCGKNNQEYTAFDASDIFDSSSAGYKKMMEEIDLVSGYLKELQDAGIPVLWRPLHEAEGNHDGNGGAWFWWGNGSGDRAAACMELWKVMYDRMVNVNGLNNLIWVWTNQITGLPAWYDECKTWYPGNGYVDIISADIYDSSETVGRDSHIDKFKKCAYAADRRKMVALAECGYIPSAQKMRERGDMWLWYMPWYGEYTESNEYNGSYWAVSFADGDILTRDKVSY